jgi:hypothetical protein
MRAENLQNGPPSVLTIDGEVSVVDAYSSPIPTERIEPVKTPGRDSASDRHRLVSFASSSFAVSPRRPILSTATQFLILDSAPAQRARLSSTTSTFDIVPSAPLDLASATTSPARPGDVPRLTAHAFTSNEEKAQFSGEQRAELEAKEAEINQQIAALLDLKQAFTPGTATRRGPSPTERHVEAAKRDLVLTMLNEINIAEEKQIEVVQKTVLRLAALDVVSIPARQIALQIAESCAALSETEDVTSSDVVETLVSSARHLLLSLCPESVSVAPAPLGESELLMSLNALREMHARLARSLEDTKMAARDLTMRHNEIVGVLTQTIENIQNAVKAGADGNPQLAAALDQATYLTAAIKEREVMAKDLGAEIELRKDREAQLIDARTALGKSNDELTFFTQKCDELTAHIEELRLQLSASQSQAALKSATPSDVENSDARMRQLLTELKQAEALAASLQNKLDLAELEHQKLQDTIAVKELENLRSYAFVAPFVVFDFWPSRAPLSIQPLAHSVVERVRVKITAHSPKIVNPGTTPAPAPVRSSTPAVHRRAFPEPIRPLAALPAPHETAPSTTTAPDGALPAGVPQTAGRPMSVPPVYESQQRPSVHRDPFLSVAVYERTVAKVRKQVQRLETLLGVRIHEVIDLRDRYLKAKSTMTDALFKEQTASRDLRKANANIQDLETQLNDAYAVINRRDAEIRRLTKLLREVSQKVQPFVVQHLVHKMTQDERNAAVLKEYRRRVAQLDISGAPAAVLSKYSMSPGMKSLIERQARAIDIWNARKNILMEQERAQLIVVLQGMRLALPEQPSSPAETPGELKLVAEKSRQQHSEKKRPVASIAPLEITALLPPPFKTRVRIDPNRSLRLPWRTNEEFDAAVLNASMPRPRLNPGLIRGVVADPVPL